MIVAVAVIVAVVIAILVLALVHHDAMKNGYKITASFSIAKQYPPQPKQVIAGQVVTPKPSLRDAGAA